MSSSSSESSSSPAPTRKKRQIEVESPDTSDDHNTLDPNSGDEDVPQPLPSAEEVTVLSHAERRRQKKKEKQLAATAGSESPRKKRKLDDGTGTSATVDAKPQTTKTTRKTIKTASTADDPGRSKRQNSIWVGNLSFRTTQDALRGFFEGVGTITRIHIPMRPGKQTPGENMGYVLFFFTPSSGASYARHAWMALYDRVARPGSRMSISTRQKQRRSRSRFPRVSSTAETCSSKTVCFSFVSLHRLLLRGYMPTDVQRTYRR